MLVTETDFVCQHQACRHHGGIRLDAGSGEALVAGPLLPPEPRPEDSLLHLRISDTRDWLFSGHHYRCCGSLQPAKPSRPKVSYRPQPIHGVYQHHYGFPHPLLTNTDVACSTASGKAKSIAGLRLRAWIRVSIGALAIFVLAYSLTVSLSSLPFASSTSTA
jgi:hypothetical protein